jgi:2-C-methyl-D-erythritol 4-phosphate cytidylyltransferase
MDRANREIIATVVPLSDRSIRLSNSRNLIGICDRRMILRVAIPNFVFGLRLLEDAYQRSHEQRLLGFEIGVEATLCEARPPTARSRNSRPDGVNFA